jgi:hypothetical protein
MPYKLENRDTQFSGPVLYDVERILSGYRQELEGKLDKNTFLLVCGVMYAREAKEELGKRHWGQEKARKIGEYLARINLQRLDRKRVFDVLDYIAEQWDSRERSRAVSNCVHKVLDAYGVKKTRSFAVHEFGSYIPPEKR